MVADRFGNSIADKILKSPNKYLFLYLCVSTVAYGGVNIAAPRKHASLPRHDLYLRIWRARLCLRAASGLLCPDREANIAETGPAQPWRWGLYCQCTGVLATACMAAFSINPGLTGYKIVFGIMAALRSAARSFRPCWLNGIRGGRKRCAAATE